MESAKRYPHTFSATWALIKEDFKTHGSDRSRPGFRALAVHRFGEWALARPNRITQFIFRQIFWTLHRYVRNHYGIEIMRGAQIGRRVIIAHQGCIAIHSGSKVGNNCLIRHCVTLGARSRKHSKSAPTLKNNVEVGVGAVIIGDVVIGQNAIIGANSVVTTDVPDNGIVIPPKPEIFVRREMGDAH